MRQIYCLFSAQEIFSDERGVNFSVFSNEGNTIIPILDGFKEKYAIEKLTVISDAGLLSKSNVHQLMSKGYHFILGARIKNEQKAIKDQILKFKLRNGEHAVIEKEESKLSIPAK